MLCTYLLKLSWNGFCIGNFFGWSLFLVLLHDLVHSPVQSWDAHLRLCHSLFTFMHINNMRHQLYCFFTVTVTTVSLHPYQFVLVPWQPSVVLGSPCQEWLQYYWAPSHLKFTIKTMISYIHIVQTCSLKIGQVILTILHPIL